MEFMDVVKGRYSCKKFDGRPVPQEQLDKILEAGRLAPTARNAQEQRVYILQSEDALAKLDAATPCRYGASTALVVAYEKSGIFTYPEGGYDSGAEDASIVATHLALAAYDTGVDSCWLNFVKVDQLAKDLRLPESETIVMVLDLGYAAKDGGAPLDNHFSRKDISETVKYL